MAVFVTGATGFTGGHLARRIADSGETVHALCRPGSDASGLEHPYIKVFEGQLTEPADIERAMAGCEKAYHVAAVFRTAGHKEDYYRLINVQGTVNVLDAARKLDLERVVHCSTGGVHGHIADPPADENAPFNPGDVYQRTKLEGELVAQERIKQGEPISIFRPAGIYGPGDLRLLKLFKTVKNGRFLMFGSGQVHFGMVYIDDLVDGILLCGEKAEALGEVFILCGPSEPTFEELVQMVADATGGRAPRFKLPLKPLLAAAFACEMMCIPLGIEPPIHRRRAHVFMKNREFTHAKAERLLGYRPKVDPAEGVRRTAAWYFAKGLLAGDPPQSVRALQGGVTGATP